MPLLNYLRCGRLILDPGVHPSNVLEEARFFGLLDLIPELEHMTRVYANDASLHSRKELQ